MTSNQEGKIVNINSPEIIAASKLRLTSKDFKELL